MSDRETTNKILSDLHTITDRQCLETIQNAAFDRARDLERQKASIETANWMVGDDVKLTPGNRGRGLYGVIGTIKKINQVKIKVVFLDKTYNVPKSMLMKV